MEVFPTDEGPTYGCNYIYYFYYIDSWGNKLDFEISKQLNNYGKLLVNTKQFTVE